MAAIILPQPLLLIPFFFWPYLAIRLFLPCLYSVLLLFVPPRLRHWPALALRRSQTDQSVHADPRQSGSMCPFFVCAGHLMYICASLCPDGPSVSSPGIWITVSSQPRWHRSPANHKDTLSYKCASYRRKRLWALWQLVVVQNVFLENTLTCDVLSLVRMPSDRNMLRLNAGRSVRFCAW